MDHISNPGQHPSEEIYNTLKKQNSYRNDLVAFDFIYKFI